MSLDRLHCADDARRDDVAASETLNGIDYVEVGANHDTLRVAFLPKLAGDPADALDTLLDDLDGKPALWTLTGGRRVRNLKVVTASRIGDEMELTLSGRGDASPYVLRLGATGIDPAYREVRLAFHAGCDSRFDCAQECVCPEDDEPAPPIDYLAKDYASFRQALLDVLPTLAPGWSERNPADLGMTVLELFAYVGDHLSYYQDAVAAEAHLETARRRISVKRHARLVDYAMHDGAAARAVVHLRLVDPPPAGPRRTLVPQGTAVLSGLDDRLLGPDEPPHGAVLTGRRATTGPLAADVVFETATDVHVHEEQNEIELWTWGRSDCCLEQGATSVDLVGDLRHTVANVWGLAEGSLLLLEEVRGLAPGLPPDAAHRQIVRLTEVDVLTDDLLGEVLTRVRWDQADALTFPLCLSMERPDGTITGISVARGNLVVADHGRTITGEEHVLAPVPEGIAVRRRARRLLLDEAPLTFAVPITGGPAARLRDATAAEAVAQVTRLTTQAGPATDDWRPVRDLLDSDPFDPDVVVDGDDAGRANLRFGDDEFGRAAPVDPAGGPTTVRVDYRVGSGVAGNLGPEALAHVVQGATQLPPIAGVRNPLPGWGGTEPEPVQRVKELAPVAFRAQQQRAVTAADYARVAEELPEVSRAVARFRWTGSWHTVFLAIDPAGRSDVDAALALKVHAHVARRAMVRYDLEMGGPTFVGVRLKLEVCARPDAFREHVESAVLETLSAGIVRGRKGLFHPDQRTFGEALHLSTILAAVDAVPGVDWVVAREFGRVDRAPAGELASGVLTAAPLEILRLDDDPDFGEHGTLEVDVRGGR